MRASPGGAPDPGFGSNLAEIREVLMAWTAGRAVDGATPEAIDGLAITLADLETPGATAEELRAVHDEVQADIDEAIAFAEDTATSTDAGFAL